jgi:hypothetical protein
MKKRVCSTERSIGIESVADARFGPEISRSSRFGLKFSPDVGHVHPQVARLVVVLRSPDLAEEAPLGDEPTFRVDEHTHNLPLQWCEVSDLSIPRRRTSSEVDLEVRG